MDGGSLSFGEVALAQLSLRRTESGRTESGRSVAPRADRGKHSQRVALRSASAVKSRCREKQSDFAPVGATKDTFARPKVPLDPQKDVHFRSARGTDGARILDANSPALAVSRARPWSSALRASIARIRSERGRCRGGADLTKCSIQVRMLVAVATVRRGPERGNAAATRGWLAARAASLQARAVGTGAASGRTHRKRPTNSEMREPRDLGPKPARSGLGTFDLKRPF